MLFLLPPIVVVLKKFDEKKGFDRQQHLARILSSFWEGTNACRPFGVLSGTELRKTFEHVF